MSQKVFDWIEAYWYARGYHDGRVVGEGVGAGLDAINGANDDETARSRYAYKSGYDTGVADYADLDVPGDAA